MSKITWTDEQKKVIDSIDNNTLVSASAGSGKTAVMLERLMRLIIGDKENDRPPVPLRRIITVTFNESVASELRAKINKKLVEQINKGICDNDYIRRQIEDLPLADISTLHAFCSNIIKANFEYLGIEPSFTIIDDEERQVLFNKAINNVMNEFRDSYDSELDVLIGYFGVEKRFFDTIKKVYEFLESQLDREGYLSNTFTSLYSGDFENTPLAKQYNIILHNECIDLLIEGNKNYAYYQELGVEKIVAQTEMCIKWLELIDKTKTFAQLIDAINTIRVLRGDKYPRVASLTKKDNLDKEYEEDHKRFFYRCKKYIENLLSRFNADYSVIQSQLNETSVYVKKIADIIAKVSKEYSRLKKLDNKMDFADLEYYAVKVMQNDDISNELSGKYDYICVDEYQDINAVQEYIITRLSNGKNLFMVGDVKQSIYQFRMTDPQIFLTKYRSYENDKQKGSPHSLNANYRSCGEVVDFVNAIFDVIMTQKEGGIDYRKESRLVQGNKDYAVQNDKPIKLVTISKDDKDLTVPVGEDGVYSVKDSISEKGADFYKEGLYIASQIAQLVGKQKIQVKLPDDSMGYREIRFSDIALLCSKRSDGVEAIVNVIKSVGIPIDSGNIVKDKSNTSIESIVNLLKVVDNHRQDIPLVASLTDKVFGRLTYSDMATIKKAYKEEKFFFNAILKYKDQKEDLISQKLKDFFGVLEEYRFASSFMSISQLIRQIMIDFDYATYLHTLEGGKSQLVGLEQFISQLENKAYNSSLVKFVEAVENINDFGKVAGESDIQGDYVKTSTIHASKGLEYPIVFIVDADHNINYDDANKALLICDKNYGVAIKNLNTMDRYYEDSLPMILLKDIKQKELYEEFMRLFYVAVTRARNKLYITATVSRKRDKERSHRFLGDKADSDSDSKPQSMWDWLNVVASQNAQFVDKYVEIVNVDNVLPEKEDTVYALNMLDIQKLKNYEKYFDKEYPYDKSTKTPVKFTVTALNNFAYENSENQSRKNAEEYIVDYKENLAEILKEDIENNDDLNLYADEGIAYHKVMEYIDFDCYTTKDVEIQLDDMLQKGLLTPTQKAFVDAENILECLRSNTISQAIKYPHYREKQFMLNVPVEEILPEQQIKDKVLLQGTIDLFIQGGEKGGENILVDFKYTKKSPDEVKQRYQRQLELYAMAIEECLNIKVDKKVIYILGQNKEIIL